MTLNDIQEKEYDSVEINNNYILLANNFSVNQEDLSSLSQEDIILKSGACCFDIVKEEKLEVLVDDIDNVYSYDKEGGFVILYCSQAHLFLSVYIHVY